MPSFHGAATASSALLAAVIGLSAITATADTTQLTNEAQPSLRKSAFEFSAHQALEGKVMGYTFLLMKDGKLVTDGAGGSARNAADGFKPMTTRTPQNLGSLFKFISGVTMLHILERPPAGSAGGQGSMISRLDAPVALLYPQIWQSAVKTPVIRKITFRQLLQHKSGFRDCGSGGDPIDCFKSPFNARLIGKRDYQNINFSLTGYLIGVYTKPDLLKSINNIEGSVAVAEKDRLFKVAAGQQMDSFIASKVFPLAPGKISASCDATNDYKNTGAYSYKSATDKGAGIFTSRKAAGKPCVGSGGYWMSIRDFAAFAAATLHSNTILSAQTRRMLYDERKDADDRLVWSFTTSDSWIKSKFEMDTIIYSGGDQPYDGGQGAHTAIVRLPLGYEALVFVNSDDLSSSALAKIGVKAFRAGMEHNF
jgi:CubicO group peptidase (beta-lactamase class C family)